MAGEGGGGTLSCLPDSVSPPPLSSPPGRCSDFSAGRLVFSQTPVTLEEDAGARKLKAAA